MYRRLRLCAAVLCLLPCAPALSALEGGVTSDDRSWGEVPAVREVDAETRAAERAARAEAIAAHLAELKERLGRVPGADAMERLHAKLREVHAAYGWAPEIGMVFGRRAIEPMLRGQETVPENLLAAFVQLRDDLAARGADLIILPLVPTPHFASHRLVEGIEAEHEYYPGWTRMMIQMMEADLEVVDTVAEFREEAGNPILVSWVNDFHTGSLGRRIAARALAERLQRYAFARDLVPNRELWTTREETRTGASFPQRITTVNRMLVEVNKGDEKPGQRTWPRKHPGKWAVLRDDAPEGIVEALAQRSFGYLELEFTGGDERRRSLRRNELVMIGDSQLHSAVYGTGLPEIIMSEVGGVFRWGSKSWRGFSPPEIYLEVVPDDAPQPRVVVLTFLPKYFWHRYKGDTVRPSKYEPRPMPEFAGAARPGDGPEVGAEPFAARVRITGVSAKATDDPTELDYDEALMHVAAVVEDGPLAGREIGLRYWILHDGGWTGADGAVAEGDRLALRLRSWRAAIGEDPGLAHHQIFNSTEQGFEVPYFWVVGGPLAPEQVLGD